MWRTNYYLKEMFEFNYTFMNRVCSETDPGCDQNDEINTKREHIIHAD